jgi:PAS domain S-box-containing protein
VPRLAASRNHRQAAVAARGLERSREEVDLRLGPATDDLVRADEIGRVTSRGWRRTMTKPLEASDSATLLASLAQNIPGAIYRCAVDPHWTMHLIGDEIERITGYPPGDFVENRRRTYMSLIHPDDRERVERDVSEAIEADRQFELEYGVLTASGDERWVLERGCAVRGHEREWLDGIIFDITDRRRFEETARRAEADAAVAREVAESRRRIVCAADDARRRIERDLHDGAQQSLVCALIVLRSALGRLADDPQRTRELLKATEDHLERGLQDLRDLAHGIHPSQLSARGVAAALSELASRASVPVNVVDGLGHRLSADVEAALYFSAAEAVTNAAKHARPTQIEVHLGRQNGSAFVKVQDDGVGGASVDGGAGLRGLSDRLATLGGTMLIASPPGTGTTLLAEIPLAA